MSENWLNAVRGRVTGIFGSTQGAWFIKRVVEPLDHALYKVSGGRLLFLNGVMPTLMLSTTGAKSGLPRTVPLLYLRDGRNIVLIASNYGSASHPAWYHNLRAHPACTVTINGCEQRRVAREAAGAEYDMLWRRAVTFYAGYRSYQARAEGRRIPIMVLEPA